jgi:hypothetical protein
MVVHFPGKDIKETKAGPHGLLPGYPGREIPLTCLRAGVIELRTPWRGSKREGTRSDGRGKMPPTRSCQRSPAGLTFVVGGGIIAGVTFLARTMRVRLWRGARPSHAGTMEYKNR